MIVSVTERQSFKRCRRQWLINARNRWSMTKIVPPNALALGTLIHDTLGIWLEMHKRYQETTDKKFLLPAGGLSTLFLQYSQKAIDTARATYEQQAGAPMSDSELSPLYEAVVQGQCMMDNYQKRWGQPVPDGFDILATEQRVQVPIPGSEHTSEYVWEFAAPPDAMGADRWVPGTGWTVKNVYDEPRLHYLEGRLDGVLREKRTGRLFTLEHKSYGQRPREDTL